MSGLKFIKSGDAKGTRPNIDLPAGRWLFLKLVIEGTTDTGQTLTLDDLGDYRIERSGRQIHGADLKFLSQYMDLKNGHPTTVTPAAGATRVATFMPFALPNQANSLDLASKEEADLQIEFGSDLSTRFGPNAVTYTLYGFEVPDIPERYELQISKQNIEANGASRESEVLNKKNIASLYLRDASDVVEKIQLVTDGETIIDNVTDDDLRDITNLLGQVESAQDIAEINLMATGNILEASNESSTLEANFSGSGTLDLVVLSVNFDSQGIERSQVAVQQRANRKIAELQSKNAKGVLQGTPAGAVRNPNR